MCDERSRPLLFFDKERFITWQEQAVTGGSQQHHRSAARMLLLVLTSSLPLSHGWTEVEEDRENFLATNATNAQINAWFFSFQLAQTGHNTTHCYNEQYRKDLYPDALARCLVQLSTSRSTRSAVPRRTPTRARLSKSPTERHARPTAFANRLDLRDGTSQSHAPPRYTTHTHARTRRTHSRGLLLTTKPSMWSSW
jgi:hypothetical protein